MKKEDMACIGYMQKAERLQKCSNLFYYVYILTNFVKKVKCGYNDVGILISII